MSIFVVRDENEEVVYAGFNYFDAIAFGYDVEVWKNKKLVGHYINKYFVAKKVGK